EELDTSGWQAELLNNRLVHIDSCAEHFMRSPMACLHVLGRVDKVFDQVLVQVYAAKQWGREWRAPGGRSHKNLYGGYAKLRESEKCLSEDAPVKPQRLMSYLSRALPDKTRIFVDAGNGWSWATHYLMRSNCEGLYRVAMSYGSMTGSIGAAIGSAVARPDERAGNYRSRSAEAPGGFSRLERCGDGDGDAWPAPRSAGINRLAVERRELRGHGRRHGHRRDDYRATTTIGISGLGCTLC